MELVTNLDRHIYKDWNETHQYGQILQSEEWGMFKSKGAWNYELIGLKDQGKLVGACMLLKRKLPLLNRYMFYAPRGFVLDYTNGKVVEEFTKHISEYARAHQGIMVKIDPCVMYREHDAEGHLVEGGFNHADIIHMLCDLGYQHKGITLDFDGIQPRFVYRLPLDRSLDALMKKFHHKTRYNIRLAEKKGVEIYEGSRDELKLFEKIMRVTGERDGFIPRSLEYFQSMYDVLYPTGKLKFYLAKYNVKKALDIVGKQLEQEESKEKKDEKRIAKLRKEEQELNDLCQEHPNGLVVSGTIMLVNGKTAWYLYGASDNAFRNIMPNYLIQWQMIQDAYEMGCTMYDFRGISGDLSPDNPLHGLYRFKKGFTGEFVEYIGEFDLIIRPLSYKLFEHGLPFIKKVIRKVKR
jgi:peptidoglycan pentaglycine glycine transferase (the first glycine)